VLLKTAQARITVSGQTKQQISATTGDFLLTAVNRRHLIIFTNFRLVSEYVT